MYIVTQNGDQIVNAAYVTDFRIDVTDLTIFGDPNTYHVIRIEADTSGDTITLTTKMLQHLGTYDSREAAQKVLRRLRDIRNDIGVFYMPPRDCKTPLPDDKRKGSGKKRDKKVHILTQDSGCIISSDRVIKFYEASYYKAPERHYITALMADSPDDDAVNPLKRLQHLGWYDSSEKAQRILQMLLYALHNGTDPFFMPQP